MRITTNTSVIAEPVFPKYTFTGKLELDESHIISLLTEINQMKLYNYNWGKSGWNTDPNEVWNMTPAISKVAPLILKQLHDSVVDKFSWGPNGNTFTTPQGIFYLEIRRCFPIILNPGHDMPIQTGTSYFSGITMLSCSANSHRPYLQNMMQNLNFEDQIKSWNPEIRQQIFVPGDVPWGISSGHDKSVSIALITHILRKRA